jgi:hypothetical protein
MEDDPHQPRAAYLSLFTSPCWRWSRPTISFSCFRWEGVGLASS